MTTDASAIEAWATNPDNRERALKLGFRIINAKNREELQEAESLGEFEDDATSWAIHNQMKAKLLVIRLIGLLKPTGEEIESVKG